MGLIFYSQQIIYILIVLILSKNVYAINESVFNVMDVGVATNSENDDSKVSKIINIFFPSLGLTIYYYESLIVFLDRQY